MGYFQLTTGRQAEQYKARWKDPGGTMKETNLPVAKQKGLVLEVNNSGKKDSILHSSVLKQQKQVLNKYTLLPKCTNSFYTGRRPILLRLPLTSGSIPVEGIPTGIVQITVFSEDEKPLAERIVMVNQQEHYFITDLNAPFKKLEKSKKMLSRLMCPIQLFAIFQLR